LSSSDQLYQSEELSHSEYPVERRRRRRRGVLPPILIKIIPFVGVYLFGWLSGYMFCGKSHVTTHADKQGTHAVTPAKITKGSVTTPIAITPPKADPSATIAKQGDPPQTKDQPSKIAGHTTDTHRRTETDQKSNRSTPTSSNIQWQKCRNLRKGQSVSSLAKSLNVPATTQVFDLLRKSGIALTRLRPKLTKLCVTQDSSDNKRLWLRFQTTVGKDKKSVILMRENKTWKIHN
jgi:hypothetical protein